MLPFGVCTSTGGPPTGMSSTTAGGSPSTIQLPGHPDRPVLPAGLQDAHSRYPGALATIDEPHYEDGARVEFEITVEGARHFVGATVVRTPFFNPSRKTVTPPP